MNTSTSHNRSGIEVFEFAPEHADQVVAMWRRSFEQALGLTDPHTIEEQKGYLLNEVVPKNHVLVAAYHRMVAAFIAATHESISQLYVDPDFQGKGLGSVLLNWAKDQSDGYLWLYTFERNKRAMRFYERNGFRPVKRGFEETWQLADIMYVWRQ
jgi:GNAT superfamily N-acetyltransferase